MTSNKTNLSQNRSIFFTLPRELRDLVYEFALTSENGLINDVNIYDHDTPQLYTNTSPLFAANPLKLVSRQMYNETLGLALQWNDLNFHHSNIWTGTELCEAFLRACSPSQLASIQRITIVQSERYASHQHACDRASGPPYRTWIRLICGASSPFLYNFCAKHPDTLVVVRYDYLKCPGSSQTTFTSAAQDYAMHGQEPQFQYMTNWTMMHACLQLTLRGGFGISFSEQEYHDVDLDRDYPSEMYEVGWFSNKVLGERYTLNMEREIKEPLDNLRITVSTSFDEDTFRNSRKDGYFTANVDLEKRIAELRTLFEEGC